MNDKERDDAHVEQHGDGDVNITVEEQSDESDEQGTDDQQNNDDN